ncbi:major facilitator superfamily domain-containing protein [Chaetomidium leptoderma]|uniref:Major facilitator superfamily domain-containing protein n=1 Tax=Chaetomidium leptoderma TaxID=669021 RepID=A0AAN6ZZQ8_9PEZI|nr:major facilitator superfamily domain-containing protein [Chaetomidium leptoderma]
MSSSGPKSPHDSADPMPKKSLNSGHASDLEASGDSEAAAEKPPTSEPEAQPNEASKATKIILISSVLLSMFLVALDRTIISTAIPAISNEFNSLNDVGWYGSAYLLTSCAFQLLFGKIYTLFSVRTVLLTSIVLFEVGSVICGAAPTSIAFILGRAVCGVGAAGLFAGTIVCIVYIVPLHQRPKIQGMFGALFGLASILGPIIGGAFTSNVTWRWCFYINLPIGGLAMVFIAWFLTVPDRDATKLPLAKKIVQLDLLGTAVLVPGVVCLLLALQWGGPTYPWSDGRIIALLTLTGVLLVSYVVVQATFTSTATIPGRIVSQRSVISALWATVCINSGNFIFIYFLPIWFQAVLGVSAVDSGIRLLPTMLSTVVGSIFGGFLNAKVGYYTPLAIVGSCVMAVGAGMLMTLQVDSGSGKWIGYQVVYGIGLGTTFQVPNLAVQAALPQDDVTMGLALMLFGSLIGSTVFVSVGENVFSNQLVHRLSGFPGFDVKLVTSGGVTALLDALPVDVRGSALVGYNEALRDVFRVGMIVSCLAILGTATLEWLSVKKPQEEKPAEPSGGVEEKKAGDATSLQGY